MPVITGTVASVRSKAIHDRKEGLPNRVVIGTCYDIFIKRDGELVWSEMVWTRDYDKAKMCERAVGSATRLTWHTQDTTFGQKIVYQGLAEDPVTA